MTSLGVARHDLSVVWNTTVRNLLIVGSILVGICGVLAGILLSDGRLTAEFLSFSLWLVTGTILPAFALLFSAVAISGARESGQLRVLFGAPINRPQFFLGTLLSRSIAAAAVSGVALTVSLIFVALTSDVISSPVILSSVSYTIGVTVVYAVIGVSISAVTRTRLRALAAGIVTYIIFGFWPQFTGSVLGLETSSSGLLQLVPRLSPFGAYSQIVTPSKAIYAASVESWHLSTPTMIVVLLSWALLSATAGYLSFCRSEIQ